MHNKVVSQISFEIGQIDRLFESYAKLLEKVMVETPDLVEITAMASVLHSFYGGLESIFLRVAKRIDQSVPAGAHWHRDLLVQMTGVSLNRESVLSVETSEKLDSYLVFRHFYRHSYSYFLEWDKIGASGCADA